MFISNHLKGNKLIFLCIGLQIVSRIASRIGHFSKSIKSSLHFIKKIGILIFMIIKIKL